MTGSSGFESDLVATIPSLRAFARMLARNSDLADDIVQETLAKAWAAQAKFAYGTNLKAWLFTIMRNEFCSQLRKQGREVQDTWEGDGVLATGLTAQPDQESSLELQELCKALAQLPKQQREALVLIGAFGHSYEEAAEISRCPEGTVKSRVNRARSRLQLMLDPPGAIEDVPISFGMPMGDPRDRSRPVRQMPG